MEARPTGCDASVILGKPEENGSMDLREALKTEAHI